MGSFAESSTAFNVPLDWRIAEYEKTFPNHRTLWFTDDHRSYTDSLPRDEPFGITLVSKNPDSDTAWPPVCSEGSLLSSRSSSHWSLEEKHTADNEPPQLSPVSNVQSANSSGKKPDTTKLAPLFYCDHPSCANTRSYKRKYDLERHQNCHHSPEKGSWYCGCCKLEEKSHKSGRKDHISQHLRGQHSLELYNPGYPCPEKCCHVGGTLLFSSTFCLNEHLVRDHGLAYDNGCSDGPRIIELSSTNNESHGGLNSLNLGQPFQHDCRKTRGVVAPRRKRPLSITTQELRHEPQPHLKRGRYRDSTTSSSANTPNRDDNDLNNSLIVAAGDTSIRSLSLANSAQVSNPVAYQNKYDFENFECTTFSSIYGSHDDPTTGFIPPATSWPFGTMRYTDPLLDAPLWRFDDHSSMEEISNVHPADFVALALQPTDWLKKLENFLQTAVTALRTAGITFITYNTTKGVIQLRGPARAAHQARLKLQGILETLLRRAGLQVVKRSSTRWSNAFADEMRSESTKRVYNGRTAGKQFHTFAVRAEDKVLIHAWNNVISPNLPNILGPRIGRSYSVNLVRLGLSELSAHPYIRIQSPRLQSSHVKKEIRKAICDLCDKSGLIHIDLRFSTGSVRLLATSRDRPPLRGQKQQEAEEEDAYSASESDDDVPEFPYHKRYWEYPGSGASIGLQCTRSVSATLGGYISVDGQSYLLAVDHFIDKSKENCSGPLADQLVLTSPSLFDVEDMSEQLEQSIQGVRAHILSLCHGLPELSRSNLPESMMVLERTEESLLELRGELVKSEDAFELGKLAHRFQRTYRSATVLNSSSSGPIKRVNHRMDWALFSVNQRQGENRHRYRYENGSMALTSDQPRGDGPLCQATCDPEPNKRVYFVGQRSGRQQGVIHPLLSTVCMDGVVTEEWSIIVQRDRPQEEWLPGDSGAWIYREDNDKLVGQLWGLHEDLLLFTPIHVVFADIKETLLATDVRLHPGFGVAQPIPVNSVASSTNTIQICEVKEKTKMPRKSRGYKLGTIPLITGGPSKAPIRPSISSILELNDSPPPLQPSTERTTCPTPKLTFSPSYASDHEFGPPTPTSSPCPASKAGLEPLLHSDLKPTPEAGPVRIRLERDGGWYGRALDQLDRLVSLVQQPVADEPAHHLAAHGESLLACYLAGKATREPGRKSLPRKAKLAPLGMARKAYTWPVATDRMGLRLLSEAIPLA